MQDARRESEAGELQDQRNGQPETHPRLEDRCFRTAAQLRPNNGNHAAAGTRFAPSGREETPGCAPRSPWRSVGGGLYWHEPSQTWYERPRIDGRPTWRNRTSRTKPDAK